MPSPNFESLMQEALIEAGKAASLGEVPVGAVVYHGGSIIARAHNRTESDSDATSHAEVLAIRDAGKVLGNWRLQEATLVVTLEPCTMCAGAIKLSRISTVVYGASDPRAGGMGTLYDVTADTRTGPAPRVVTGISEEQCKTILKDFFLKLRNQ